MRRLLYVGSAVLLGPVVVYGLFWFISLNDWCYQRFSYLLFRTPENWTRR